MRQKSTLRPKGIPLIMAQKNSLLFSHFISIFFFSLFIFFPFSIRHHLFKLHDSKHFFCFLYAIIMIQVTLKACSCTPINWDLKGVTVNPFFPPPLIILHRYRIILQSYYFSLFRLELQCHTNTCQKNQPKRLKINKYIPLVRNYHVFTASISYP